MILIDKNERPQQIPGKANLTKVDGCFVDDFGTIPITLWNEEVGLVKSGEYDEFQNMILRKWKSLLVFQRSNEDQGNQHRQRSARQSTPRSCMKLYVMTSKLPKC